MDKNLIDAFRFWRNGQTRLFQGDDATEFESRVAKARTDVFDSLCAEYFCSLRAESF